jgi:hypothetical protein
MAKGWTEERRKQQAERIRRTRPWEKSTGPKTAAGKKRSSLNAWKHGGRCRVMDEYRHLLALNRVFVKQFVSLYKMELETEWQANELKELRAKAKKINRVPHPARQNRRRN